MFPLLFDHFAILPVTMEDATDYFALIDSNRERISTYFPFTSNANTDLESTKRYLSERIAFAEKNLVTILIIKDDFTKNIAGAIIFKDVDWTIPKCELGFFMDQQFEGNGLMTKSLLLVIDFCFREAKLNKLFLRISPENLSSIRVAEKTGFMKEGIIRNDFKTGDGKLKDLIYFGLLQP